MTERRPSLRWPELLWTFFSGAGVVLTILVLREALDDLEALRLAGRNGRTEMLARTKVRSGWIRLHAKLVAFAVGLAALAYERDAPPAWLGRFILVSLLAIVGTLDMESLYTLYDRAQLRRERGV